MKRMVGLLLIVFMLFGMTMAASVSTSALPFYTEGCDLSYYDEIMPHFYPEYFKGRDDFLFCYDMLYAHEGESEQPEYIVFIAYFGVGDEAIAHDSFGDYAVYNTIMDFPYELSHYVYVPAEQKVYTLREAYDSEKLDISAAFKSGNVGVYHGKEPQYRYKNQFMEQYSLDSELFEDLQYAEVYDHFAGRSMPPRVDWVLVYAYVSGPTPRECYAVLNDRVSLQGDCSPFSLNYGVYDMNSKTYIDICDIEDLSTYSGLQKQIDKLELGTPIGDADSDGVLSIFDATYIQRVQAQLCDYSDIDDLSTRHPLREELKYISDFNRDGERSVLDATEIQIKLAKIN